MKECEGDFNRRLERLWEEFGDIAIDDEDRILSPFLHFEAGTDRFEIWEWFDERYPGGVNRLMEVCA